MLIPPRNGESDWTDEEAARLVGHAANQKVECLDAGPDALDTIHAAVEQGDFDEIVVCTHPEHLACWVQHDLPHRLDTSACPSA